MAVVIFMTAIAAFYRVRRRSTEIADMACYAALWIAFTMAGAIFTYLTATLRLPLRDAELQAVDAWLGFNWLDWFRFVGAHPVFKVVLAMAYSSLMLQIVGSVLYFSYRGTIERSDRLWWAAIVSLILTSLLSGAIPALGAGVHLGAAEIAQATYLPHLLALRDGSASTFSVESIQGIVTFPSYHTVLAVLLTHAYLGSRRMLLFTSILNGLMLLSIPLYGSHYLSDMLAGGAVAAVSILIAGRIRLRSIAVNGQLDPSARNATHHAA